MHDGGTVVPGGVEAIAQAEVERCDTALLPKTQGPNREAGGALGGARGLQRQPRLYELVDGVSASVVSQGARLTARQQTMLRNGLKVTCRIVDRRKDTD